MCWAVRPPAMPDDTLHIDRFIFTEPRERPDGKGWTYLARTPEDPTEYTGWLYPNTCSGNELSRVLEAVTTARAIHTPNVLRLHAAGHKRPAIGPAQGYLYAVTDAADPSANVEQALLPQAPVPIQGLVVGLFELVTAIRDMASFPFSHGWLGPGHCLLRDDGHLTVVNPWQGWVEDRQRQIMTTGTSDWQYTWVAPETVFDPSKIDIASDLFTACAIAFTLATGQPPFDSASALALDPSLFTLQVPDSRQLRSDIPEGLARIFERGLAATWAERYHRPEELLADLRAVVQGKLPGAAAPARPPPVASAPHPASSAASSASGRMRSSSGTSSRVSPPSSVSRRREALDPRGSVVSTSRVARTGSDPAMARRGREKTGGSPVPIIALVVGGCLLVAVAVAVLAGGGGGPSLQPRPVQPAPDPTLVNGGDERPQPRPRTTDPEDPTPGPGQTNDSRPRGGMFATLDDPVDISELPPVELPPPMSLTAPPVDVDALRPGLEVRSYTGSWGSWRDIGGAPVVERKLVHDADLDPRPRDDWYALRFDGYLHVERAGVHTMWLISDDGSALWMDGALVIDNDGYHGSEAKFRQVEMEAGYHQIRVVYFQGDGDSELRVEWQPPGEDRGSLGPNRVFHLPEADSPKTDPPPPPAGELVRVVAVGSGKAYGVRTAIDHGVQIYLDRAYRVPELPVPLVDGELVVTANDDKDIEGDPSHLQLELTQPADVYLAFAQDLGAKPDWADDFEPAGFAVTSDYGRVYSCYRKRFAAGGVTLGSNKRQGSASHYLVFVVAADEALATPAQPPTAPVEALPEPPVAPAQPSAAIPEQGPALDPGASPVPALAPGEREQVTAAIEQVLSGGSIPTALPEGWQPLVADVRQGLQDLPRMLIANERRLRAKRATVRINRTELEIAGASESGMRLTTNGGRSEISMGWDRVPLIDLLPAIQVVLYDLTPEERDAVRLVLSARGPIDSKLERHRAALELLRSEAEPAPTPGPAQPGAIPVGPEGTWLVTSIGQPDTSLRVRHERKRQPVVGHATDVGDERQHLVVTPSDDPGWYRIATVGGMVLECFAQDDGEPVTIYQRNGEPWQDWRFERQFDGSYAIIGRHNPRALSLSESKATCSDFAGLPTQRWQLVPVQGAATSSVALAPEPGVVRPTDPREIVLLPTDADASRAGGDFKLRPSATATTGVAWETATANRFGSEVGTRFRPDPETPHLTYRFEAVGGQTYHLWLRGRLGRTGKDPTYCDALMMTFTTPVRFVSDPRRDYIVEERRGDSFEINGWGRTDGWFWCNGLSDDRLDQDQDERPIRVQFERSGVQELRVFLGEGPHQFDLIWLSTSRDRRFEPNRVPPQAFRD